MSLSASGADIDENKKGCETMQTSEDTVEVYAEIAGMEKMIGKMKPVEASFLTRRGCMKFIGPEKCMITRKNVFLRLCKRMDIKSSYEKALEVCING